VREKNQGGKKCNLGGDGKKSGKGKQREYTSAWEKRNEGRKGLRLPGRVGVLEFSGGNIRD